MDRNPPITSIFGRKGTGKSSLARFLLAEALQEKPGIVVDPFGLYWDLEKSGKGLKRIPTFDPFLCDARDSVIAVDELLFSIDEAGFLKRLSKAFAVSRHRGQTWIVSTFAPTFIPRAVTAQSDFICLFQTTEGSYLDYFRTIPGIRKEHLDRLPWLPIGSYLRVKVGG